MDGLGLGTLEPQAECGPDSARDASRNRPADPKNDGGDCDGDECQGKAGMNDADLDPFAAVRTDLRAAEVVHFLREQADAG